MAPVLLFRSTRDDLKLFLLTHLIAKKKSVRRQRMDKIKLQKSAFQYERKCMKTHGKKNMWKATERGKKLVVNETTFVAVILFSLNR